MHQPRSLINWLIVAVSVSALSIGLAIGWMWYVEATEANLEGDNPSTHRLALCIGFIMAYLAWTTVVMAYLVLRRPAPVDVPYVETVELVALSEPTTVPVAAPAQVVRASPPQARAQPTSIAPATTPARPAAPAPPATPAPQWVRDLKDVQASAQDPAALPNPNPSSWVPDVKRAEEGSRRSKE
jgi:hypothetical protein